ncbi:hypothetical protein G7046_g5804 [Stylonectria norvegica]|nr:hypothetical protein G7046_g5804 [Stylonectria norvegica]
MLPRVFLTALALARLGGAEKVVLENTPTLPVGWEKLDRSPKANHPLRLSIALRQPDIDSLDTRIGSRKYFSSKTESNHLTREEARSLRVPDQEDVNGVLKWLKSHGMAAKATQDKDWVHVMTTVGKAELVLDTDIEFYSFENKKPVLRARSYSVPKSVSDSISFIHPIANFVPAKKELTSAEYEFSQDIEARQNIPCGTGTDPECIRKLYNITYQTPDGASPIRLGVAGFLEQNANFNDIDTFLKARAKPVWETGHNFSVELLNGGQNLQDLSQSGIEATLDIEYALPLSYPANIIYYSTGGRGPQLNDSGEPVPDEYAENEPYLEFLEYLLEKPNDEIPQVISISYADDEVSVPRLYAERVCSMFGILTARGTTILAGSGDGGARGARNSTCRTNDGSEKDVAMASFPASCPWVTAVGAVTNFDSPPKGAIFSGGGFSQYFPQQHWQNTAVASYERALSGHLEGYYNASMRALPDISVVGTNFVVRSAGSPGILHGTSASTPVLAAMIALVNDARVRRGKEVLGWINELLYIPEVQAVLLDVFGGQSTSCTFGDGNTPGGWPAAVGWDAITGLGVPSDFCKFLQILLDA